MIGKIWQWFDGKKTLVGSVVLILSTIADQSAVLLPAFLGPAEAVQYLGYVTVAIGIVHKVYKFIYKTDAPKG